MLICASISSEAVRGCVQGADKEVARSSYKPRKEVDDLAYDDYDDTPLGDNVGDDDTGR